ncbi:hypothetical protein OAS39_09935 [Pirellulales bacterium]|nr:hypothetical protein [Pirellulales bacterium]
MKTSQLLAIAAICLVLCGPANGADRTADWDESDGFWSDPSRWMFSPNPNEPDAIPDNGQGGFTYSVQIDSGTVDLQSDIEIENLWLGAPSGNGELNIANGSTLVTNDGAVIGSSKVTGFQHVRGFGTASVSGAGSTWNNTGAMRLGIHGSGTLSITDGGVVSTTSLDAGMRSNAYSPPLLGGGDVVVSGPTSTLSVADQMDVGVGGVGDLVVENNAALTASTLRIGDRGEFVLADAIVNGNTQILSGGTFTGRGALNGNLTQSPGANLHLELSSGAPQLNIQGMADLSGKLSVTFGSPPSAGEYSLVDYQGLTGQFDAISVDGLGSSEYSLNYGSGVDDVVTLSLSPRPKAASSIYWTDSINNTINWSNLDGSAQQVIIPNIERPRGIEVDPINEHIYWVDDTMVRRANLDGTNVEPLDSALRQNDGDVAIDSVEGKVYWTDLRDSNIRRSNLDGSNPENWLPTDVGAQGIVVDSESGKVYWANFFTNEIERANADGTDREAIVTGQSNPRSIALDSENGRVYWSSNQQSQIRSANLDGSDVQTVLDVDSDSGTEIALDGFGSIYFTTHSITPRVSTLRRAAVDGSNVVVLIETPGAIFDGLSVALFDDAIGDHDRDGDVDGADLIRWQRDDRTSAGLLHWENNFGAGPSSSSNGSILSVPEPASAALTILCSFLIACRRQLFLSTPDGRRPDSRTQYALSVLGERSQIT